MVSPVLTFRRGARHTVRRMAYDPRNRLPGSRRLRYSRRRVRAQRRGFAGFLAILVLVIVVAWIARPGSNSDHVNANPASGGNGTQGQNGGEPGGGGRPQFVHSLSGRLPKGSTA